MTDTVPPLSDHTDLKARLGRLADPNWKPSRLDLNLRLCIAILAEAGADHLSPGYIVHFAGRPSAGWLECDGRFLPVSGYPGLFAAIGNTYCPREIPHPAWWARALRWTGLAKPAILNPEYRPGSFRIPDLRGHVTR